MFGNSNPYESPRAVGPPARFEPLLGRFPHFLHYLLIWWVSLITYCVVDLVLVRLCGIYNAPIELFILPAFCAAIGLSNLDLCRGKLNGVVRMITVCAATILVVVLIGYPLLAATVIFHRFIGGHI